MAIQKQFILRYRDEGHLRFQIPEQFCELKIAQGLTAQLLAIEGVYRVQVHRSQKKLIIRYQETACDFKTLAKRLFQIITELTEEQQREAQSAAANHAKPFDKIKEKVKNLKVSRWFGEKYTEGKETLQAAKILSDGLKKNKTLIQDPEKAVIDFLNDMLVLFLIKLHWEHITKQWIPQPFKYRNEWAAVFYMLFLLMRSRKPKK
jgi:hypothetical protein